jgi:hypothetical protein
MANLELDGDVRKVVTYFEDAASREDAVGGVSAP